MSLAAHGCGAFDTTGDTDGEGSRTPQLVTGRLAVVFESTSSRGEARHVGVHDSAGRFHELAIDDADRLDIERHVGAEVAIEGVAEAGMLHVRSIETVGAPAATSSAALTGSWPIATLGCLFSDIGPAPHPIENLYAVIKKTTYGGISHYYRSVSQDQFDLAGSRSFGWFMMPRPSTAYVTAAGGPDISAIAADCIARADASVWFLGFKGINIAVNGGLGAAGWGGANVWYTLDGQSRPYGVTWLNTDLQWDGGNPVHEIGHSLGLNHARLSWDYPYGNRFDPMGGGNYKNWIDGVALPTYFHAYHRSALGWINPSIATAPAGRTTTYQLQQADASSGTLMVKVFLNDSGWYYAVEARRRGGTNRDGTPSYEADLPNEGVTITFIAPRPGYWETVLMDEDYNGEPDDEGAIVRVGETYTDLWNGARVSVLSATATGYSVSVTSPVKLSVPTTGQEYGAVTMQVTGAPARSCSGSTCAYWVLPGGEVRLTPAPTSTGKFVGWTGCPSASGTTCVLSPTSDVTVTAAFAKGGTFHPACYSACLDTCTQDTPFAVCQVMCRDDCTF